LTRSTSLAGLEAVSFVRGEKAVLEDISLTIPAGSFTAIIGPSGCGKTTLLRLLAGLEQPDFGQVMRATQRISYVFQQPTLLPWANALANVAKPLALAGMGRAAVRKRAKDALEQVGMGAEAGLYPHQLSGGMAQRVAIARALAGKPDLLLMDEPFGALDALTREAMNDDLLALWRASGTAIVFVTHAIDEAVFLAERIVVMTPLPGRIGAVVENSDGMASKRNSRVFVEMCSKVRGLLG